MNRAPSGPNPGHRARASAPANDPAPDPGCD